jgi:hypothetical protein
LQTEVDQPAGELGHDLAELREGDVMPLAVALVSDRRAVTEPLGREGRHVGDRG